VQPIRGCRIKERVETLQGCRERTGGGQKKRAMQRRITRRVLCIREHIVNKKGVKAIQLLGPRLVCYERSRKRKKGLAVRMVGSGLSWEGRIWVDGLRFEHCKECEWDRKG